MMSVFGRLALARNGEIDEPVEELIEGFFDPGSRNSSDSAPLESDRRCCQNREGDRLRFQVGSDGAQLRNMGDLS